MRILLCCLAIFVISVISARAALAFEPAVGDRAYPIVGHDIVSGRMMSLEDQLGKWVLLEFWASW